MTLLATKSTDEHGIDDAALGGCIDELVQTWVVDKNVRRLLILPPDHTRLHSRAGEITTAIWQRLVDHIHVDVMPALGTHIPMTRQQCELMFGNSIPFDRILPHRWKSDLTRLGEISAAEMSEVSDGAFSQSMNVEVNSRLVSGTYDLVISVGQVVPHEVIGMANYTKNVCIGAGGKDVIHKSHFLGAVVGMESIMGQCDTPVRTVIDRAYEKFVRPKCEVGFVLTVVQESNHQMALRGLFAGMNRDGYEAAARLSQQVNVKQVGPIQRCVVTLDPQEFKSTWLGNKAIYRARLAMADEGELYILAPGIQRFGEDDQIDHLIRKHGYRGTPATLSALHDPLLQGNLSAAAHLIHGSSEGRFRIIYCTGAGLTESEVRQVGFDYRPMNEVVARFQVDGRAEGWYDDSSGEQFYLIRNPGLGLWRT